MTATAVSPSAANAEAYSPPDEKGSTITIGRPVMLSVMSHTPVGDEGSGAPWEVGRGTRVEGLGSRLAGLGS
ncbi:hypothetical protein GCM10009544_35510 [Streptomyces stramineus]|uniref:Uncharacterized protein n=1 Tax=Streptomyces stramineus TaxID=173861 RepID=A0ABN1A8M1_9ACTN